MAARILQHDDMMTSTININTYPSYDYVKGQYIPGTLNSGDTAWMLAATAIVLFMTMPGLAIYYSGMVRDKNVLACKPTCISPHTSTTLELMSCAPQTSISAGTMQVFTIACLITFLWLVFGYSLAFSPAQLNGKINEVYGNGDRLWLRGMMTMTSHALAPTVPEAIFCAYQLTFAIITAGLICGSFADRMKYHSMIIFIAFWHLMVYCPIAHSNWHPQGWLYRLGVLDYAGGNVVHIASGKHCSAR